MVRTFVNVTVHPSTTTTTRRIIIIIKACHSSHTESIKREILLQVSWT
jgi:hypothetical protein